MVMSWQSRRDAWRTRYSRDFDHESGEDRSENRALQFQIEAIPPMCNKEAIWSVRLKTQKFGKCKNMHTDPQFPTYPDFGDTEMPVRHSRLLDLRHKFLAHSSAEGTRVQIIPSGITNPFGVAPKSTFDFKIGKRTFRDIGYVAWLRVAPVTFKSRLHSDISQLLAESFGGDSELDAPFELPTGHESFQWT